MTFYLYLFLGFLGGIPAGMGMGGGTVTIPLLTLLGGVAQKTAQAANLFAFLPMSLFALSQHRKNGLLKPQGIWQVAIPAALFSAPSALLATVLSATLLRKLFGGFLLLLALFTLTKNTNF